MGSVEMVDLMQEGVTNGCAGGPLGCRKAVFL